MPHSTGVPGAVAPAGGEERRRRRVSTTPIAIRARRATPPTMPPMSEAVLGEEEGEGAPEPGW